MRNAWLADTLEQPFQSFQNFGDTDNQLVLVIRPVKIICVFQINYFRKRYERGLKQNTNLKKYNFKMLCLFLGKLLEKVRAS